MSGFLLLSPTLKLYIILNVKEKSKTKESKEKFFYMLMIFHNLKLIFNRDNLVFPPQNLRGTMATYKDNDKPKIQKTTETEKTRK